MINYNIKAALFDLDGVVAFTDRYHFLAWKELCNEKGWYFDEKINNKLRGIPRKESLEIILEHNNVDISEEEKNLLADKKNKTYVKLLDNVNKEDEYVGVVDFIKSLRSKGIKTAICSSSKNANFVLEKLNILDLFDAVVTGNDIKKAKPNPEIFLLGAKRLGIPAFHCVVFEDSSVGIEAAHAAGMKSCGVGNYETYKISDEFIKNYSEIDIESFLESGHKESFKVNPYRVYEKEIKLRDINHVESIFALGNGYMGMRGVYEETDLLTEKIEKPGMYINGVFDKEKISHAAFFNGFSTHDQFTVNLIDWRFISLYIDAEKVSMTEGKVKNHVRYLDMKRGVLFRSFEWCSNSGKIIHVESIRMVNLRRFHGAEIKYSVTPVNFDGEIKIISSVKKINPLGNRILTENRESGSRSGAEYMVIATKETNISVASAIINKIEGAEFTNTEIRNENEYIYEAVVNAIEGKTFSLTKFAAFYSDNDDCSIIDEAINDVVAMENLGFDALLFEQEEEWSKHWDIADIKIYGNETDDMTVRFNLFHLRQQLPPQDDMSIGATGLTGQSYSGKVFWDTEMYIAPYFNYTSPEKTKRFLMYRYKILDKARERAELMGGKGALFSWCSVDGEETSVVFEASTAEYHLQSDIAFAIKRYVSATKDYDFLYNYGAEILFDTAVYMFNRGNFIEGNDNKFCLNVVCGPDEYACGVNNNFYTNMMLKSHFEYAVKVYEQMNEKVPDKLSKLSEKLNIDINDVRNWSKAASNMYYKYNKKLGIYEQDDSFVTNDSVDMDTIPKNFDIRATFHPLNLWRIQVLKQADVVLLMFVQGDNYSLEEKKNSYEYYEPKTNHGSSLSAAVHSIMACEINKPKEAYAYFRSAAYMDLCDFKHNTNGGLHMACLGGVWMNVVNGFLGMRDYEGGLEFNPKLPSEWKGCKLKLAYKGSYIEINADNAKIEFTLISGGNVEFACYGNKYLISKGEPVKIHIK
ncbi:MAG: beta-phosphoglucomutase [Bacillota bacterium]|nr:beta-phosphoglucomutase [Bacillota bacterium]